MASPAAPPARSPHADVTWNTLIAAITAAGGPVYQYRQIDPVDDQDGGAPGGNIRQGFLFRTDRGLAFVDRPGGTSTNSTEVVRTGRHGARLTFSPGRIEPGDPAFTTSRKPLAGEFTWKGKTVIAVANHFNSKGGDDPLFGHLQPPVAVTETQRHEQARIVNSVRARHPAPDLLATTSWRGTSTTSSSRARWRSCRASSSWTCSTCCRRTSATRTCSRATRRRSTTSWCRPRCCCRSRSTTRCTSTPSSPTSSPTTTRRSRGCRVN